MYLYCVMVLKKTERCHISAQCKDGTVPAYSKYGNVTRKEISCRGWQERFSRWWGIAVFLPVTSHTTKDIGNRHGLN